MKKVRVRFAPSPTGPLHIGGVRTALYNYLFAKKNKGSFILRIEDTDRTRYVPGAEDYIFQSLDWLGIIPDESLRHDGEFGPYRQSENMEAYKNIADHLVESGYAYYAFDTPQEIEEMREKLQKEKDPNPTYNSKTRSQMKNSLTLDKSKVLELIGNKVPYVVRLKVPENETIKFTDLIRGDIEVNSIEVDDKILLKSDGMPTYHLANVVDDHAMEISHVIRGEEWLPSAPLHVLLYKYLEWEEPQWAHLPLLLKPDGKGKLSKRDGLKHGFPVFPLNWKDRESGQQLTGFKETGFLPEATINFLALLGWNPGDDRELFTLEELIETFSIERINKAGAKFDIQKATWFNEHYLRQLSTESLVDILKSQLLNNGVEDPEEYDLASIVEMMRERISFPNELYPKSIYFYQKPNSYDEKAVRKKWTRTNVDILSAYAGKIKDLPQSEFNELSAKETLISILELYNSGLGQVMQPLRVALTGLPGGPDLWSIMKVLGVKECSERIELAIEKLSDQVKE